MSQSRVGRATVAIVRLLFNLLPMLLKSDLHGQPCNPRQIPLFSRPVIYAGYLLQIMILCSMFISPASQAASGQCRWEGGPGAPTYPSCALEDCVEDGGQAICTKPIVGEPGMFTCVNNSLSTTINAESWCQTNVGMHNPEKDESIVKDKIECLPRRQNNACRVNPVTINWLPFGTKDDTYSFQCWKINVNDITDFAVTRPTYFTGPACDEPHTYYPVIVRKDRPVECPLHYFSRTLSNGDKECWRKDIVVPECTPKQPAGDCAGNPIQVATGKKIQVEVDYTSPLAGGLRFIRTYNSYGYYRPRSLHDIDPYPLGEVWTHNYQQRIYPTTESTSTAAAALRPNGNVKFFNLDGSEALNTGSKDRLVQTATGWRYTTGEEVIEDYGVDGKLISITDHGRTVSMQYSDAGTPSSIAPGPGFLIQVQDWAGHTLSFHYDESGRMLGFDDPADQEFLFEYNGPSAIKIDSQTFQTRLTKVTYPDSTTRTYYYNEQTLTSNRDLPQVLTGIVDEDSIRYASWAYNSSEQAIRSEHANGVERTTINFGTGVVGVQYANGGHATYTLTSIAGVLRATVVDHTCVSSSGLCPIQDKYTYDAVTGDMLSHKDPKGTTTIYSYDPDRHLEISRTEASGTPQQRTILTEWHPDMALPVLVTESNRSTAFSYDANGNLLVKTVTDLTNGTSRTWRYTYNSFGQIVTEDGPRTDVIDTTTYTYYSCTTGFECGQVHTMTNALGQVTTFNSYNANGQPLSITDPNGVVTLLTYDARQRLTSRTAGSEVISFSYTPSGLLRQVALADGSSLTYTYDDAHRLIQIQDAAGDRIVYTLDAMSNRVAEEIHDSSNNLIQTHSRTFNALNQLASDINAANAAAVTTTFGYDKNNNQTTINAPLSRNSTNVFDVFNRLTQVTDPGNGVTHYGYDANDHLINVTDPRGLQTTYNYDALDNLLQMVSPDTGTTTNTYDAAGNLKTSTDARGAVTTYSYDALNRVTQISATLGSNTSTTTYQYDTGPHAKGMLTRISDVNSTLTYSYNSLGRLSSKTQQLGAVNLTVSYGYDSAGRLSQITYPSGKVVSYSYDSQGHINAISADAQTLLSNIQYSPFGAATGWSWGNGGSYSRPLDSDGRVASFTLNGYPRTVSYDAASRITALNDATVQTFGYNKNDRLTSYSALTANQSFSYDAVGNRTQLIDGGSLDTYSYAATSNRLTAISGSHNRSYSYTANGNTAGDGSRTYGYDPRNRMVSTNSSSYTLNGLGQRIQKHVASGQSPGDADGDNAYTSADGTTILNQILQTGTAGGNPDCNQDSQVNVQDLVCLNIRIANSTTPGGGTTLFAYDEQGQLIGEYDQSGNALQETVYLGSQPVAVLKSSNVYYIHTDQLNTPRVITDSANTVVWRWDSDPFGATAANDDPDLDGTRFTYNLRFPGQYYDQETGLHYNYFRDYDPGTGRYVESDPVGLKGGFNTYAYVYNNPLKYVDPLGLIAANGGVCAGAGAFVLVAGVSSGTCTVAGTDGKVCSYSYLCMRLGGGFFFGAGTSFFGGITSGTDSLDGWSIGLGGDVGLGPSVSGQVSGGPSGVTANLPAPGVGIGLNIGADFCIFEKIGCQDGDCENE